MCRFPLVTLMSSTQLQNASSSQQLPALLLLLPGCSSMRRQLFLLRLHV